MDFKETFSSKETQQQSQQQQNQQQGRHHRKKHSPLHNHPPSVRRTSSSSGGNPLKQPPPLSISSSSSKRGGTLSKQDLLEDQLALFDLTSSAKKHHSHTTKINLSHLLNFTFPPRQPYAFSSSANKPSRRNSHGNSSSSSSTFFNKERFVNANYRFVLAPSASSSSVVARYLGDPDATVEWDDIVQVIMPTPNTITCPICLGPPVAARLTKCGHVYCWHCLCQYLNTGPNGSLSPSPTSPDPLPVNSNTTTTNSTLSKKWKKCPICYDAVYLKDVKSVRILHTRDISLRKYSIPSLTSAAAVAVTTAATAAAVSVGGALVSTSPIIGASSLGSGGGAGSATSYSSSSSSSPSAAAASIAAGFDVSGFYGNSDANPESDEDLRSSHNHRGGQRVPPSPDFPAQLKMTLMKRAVYSTIALPRTSYRAWELEESRFVTISATSRGKSPTATTSTTRVTPAFPPLVTNHHALLFAKVVMASPTYLCEEILGKQIKELKAVVAENESLIGGGVDEDRLFIDLCLAELEPLFADAKTKAEVYEKMVAVRTAAVSPSRKRQNHHFQASASNSTHSNPQSDTQESSSPISQLSKAIIASSSTASSSSSSSSSPSDTVSDYDAAFENSNHSSTSSSSTTATDTRAPLTSSSGGAGNNNYYSPTPTPEFYYYYQASDGQHLFLHPLDIKLLKHEFGTYSAFPDKMDVDVIYLSDTTIDEDLRRRCKHLEHLPLSCDAGFVECDWSGVVSQSTMDFFAKEIAQRIAKRAAKEKKEEQERRRQQHKQDMIDKHYQTGISGGQFTPHHPSSTSSSSTSSFLSSPNGLAIPSASYNSVSTGGGGDGGGLADDMAALDFPPIGTSPASASSPPEYISPWAVGGGRPGTSNQQSFARIASSSSNNNSWRTPPGGGGGGGSAYRSLNGPYASASSSSSGRYRVLYNANSALVDDEDSATSGSSADHHGGYFISGDEGWTLDLTSVDHIKERESMRTMMDEIDQVTLMTTQASSGQAAAGGGSGSGVEDDGDGEEDAIMAAVLRESMQQQSSSNSSTVVNGGGGGKKGKRGAKNKGILVVSNGGTRRRM